MYPHSPVKANVGRLCEKLKTRQETVGDKIYGGSFAGFFSSADSGGSQRTGKCMYIKARWNQGLQMRRSEQFCWQRKATLWPREGRPPVSACVPLCAILLRKASVYPLSPAKANVGHLCEKLKIGMRSGWEQRCDGNFLAIFAGTVLGEKPNFTGRFFGRRRPFDFSTDKERCP